MTHKSQPYNKLPERDFERIFYRLTTLWLTLKGTSDWAESLRRHETLSIYSKHQNMEA